MTLNGQALFTRAVAGLNNTYSSFAKYYPNGITLNDLTNPKEELAMTYNTNQSFIQYLSTNFSNVDKNGDGVIDANDLNELTNNMQTSGMTYEEIVQLCYTNGSNSLLETVLVNFDEIDKNKDGKITNEEITAYSQEEDRAKAEKEYASYRPSNMTTFYYDDISSDDNDVKYSVLDSKYTSTSSNNSN